MYRRALLVVMTVILPASALMTIFPQTVSADGTPEPYLAPVVLDAAKKSTERNSLAVCMSHKGPYGSGGAAFKNSDYGTDIKPSDIASGSWFSDYTSVRQWSDYNKGSDGTGCDKLNVGDILQDLDFTAGNIQAACALGVQRQDSKLNCVNGKDGSGDMLYINSSKQKVLDAIDKTYKGTTFGKDYTAEQYYVMAVSVLMNSKTCKASPLALSSTATPDQKAQSDATITIVGSDGVATQVVYKFGGDKGTKWSFMNKTGDSDSYVTDKCSDLAKVANDNANAYAKWVGKNQPGTAGNPGTCEQYSQHQVESGGGNIASGPGKTLYDKLLTACNDGFANKATANYCDRYKNADENAACKYGVSPARASTPTGDDTTDTPTADDKPTCGVQGIGWLVCPVMNFMAKITDAAYNFLASYFLTVDTKLVEGSQPAWARFRDIANVAFVIAIIFVVYSQVTSFGISNYGIKRMLPRIIVAALLVNVSFYICAAAVDLSNLLGYAIPQFFGNIPIGAGLKDSGDLATLGSGLSWVAIIGGVIVAAVGVALAISVPVLLAALLAIGLIVLMLVARQALVVLLIVISPLAFVAYLLPNTEQWFKKWYKMLFTLLMLFPVIGTVFGASRMAALIIVNTGGVAGGSEHIITQLIALAVSAIPFFVVPGMLKGSLSAAGAIGAKLQGAANKATGRIGSQVKSTSRLGTGLDEMKRYRSQQRAIGLAKGRGKGVMGAVGRVAGGKGYNTSALARANALGHEEYEKSVKDAGASMSGLTYARKMQIARGEGEAVSAFERDAAVREMMDKGNFDERHTILRSLGTMDSHQRKSAVEGAFKKGDGSVYGSSTLGTLQDLENGSPEFASTEATAKALANGAAKRIETGDFTPETFTRDSQTAAYASQITQGTVKYKDSEGNAVSVDVPNKVSDDKLASFAQSLTNYASSDQGKKVASSVQGHIGNVVAAAPAGSVQPAATPPAQPAPTTPSTPPTNPTTLTIPHGGGPAPAPTTPGNPGPLPPGMVQRPSGFVVPGNTPPPPPPSNT